MKEEKRNKTLIRIATKAVKTYIPDYYREYCEPIISKDTIRKDQQENPEYGHYHGRVLYSVTFLCDENTEFFLNGFAAKINIWGDTGDLSTVMCGNLSYGYAFKEKESRTLKKVLYKFVRTPKPHTQRIKPVYTKEEYEEWLESLKR